MRKISSRSARWIHEVRILFAKWFSHFAKWFEHHQENQVFTKWIFTMWISPRCLDPSFCFPNISLQFRFESLQFRLLRVLKNTLNCIDQWNACLKMMERVDNRTANVTKGETSRIKYFIFIKSKRAQTNVEWRSDKRDIRFCFSMQSDAIRCNQMHAQMKSETVEHKMAAKCWTKVVVDNCKICAKFVLSPTSHLDINCTKIKKNHFNQRWIANMK